MKQFLRWSPIAILFFLVTNIYASALTATDWLPAVQGNGEAVIWNLEKLPADIHKELNRLVKNGEKGIIKNPLRDRILKVYGINQGLEIVNLRSGNKRDARLDDIVYHRDKGDICLYEASAYLGIHFSPKVAEKGAWVVLPSDAQTKPTDEKTKREITQIYQSNSEVKSRKEAFGSIEMSMRFALTVEMGSNKYSIASYPGNMDTYWIFQNQKPTQSAKEVSSFYYPPCGG